MLVALLCAALACATDKATAPDDVTPPSPASESLYFPPATGAWETATAPASWDTVALRSALDWAGTRGSTAVIVVWKGRIVAERYWNGWTPEKDSLIASAGKSVTSTLLGILHSEGRLSLDASVGSLLGAGWSRSASSEQRIAVRHLLTMTSGLDDSLRFVADPGTRFYYNNPAYYQTFAILARAGGAPFTIAGVNALSRTLLFDRIGMSSANWRLNIDHGEPGFVLWCTPRDMARFGLLTLAGGAWNGTRVLGDTAYARAMLRPSSTSNPSYGYLWWLNGQGSYRIPGPYLLPTVPGPLVPSAPPDLVAALGKGDKKIYVVPSLDLVIVRQGPEADNGGGNPLALSAFDNELWTRLRTAFRY